MGLSSKELAAKLGVSPSLVSLALNGKKGVSEKNRALILAAAEENNVKLRTTSPAPRSKILNFVIYKKHGLVVGDTDFFSSVTEGITREALLHGYRLQLSYFYADQDVKEQLRAINSCESAGIILLATEMVEKDIPIIYRIQAPLILLDAYFETENLDSIGINNFQGAYQATKYLIQSGHTRIGHLASSVDIINFRERHAGFLKAINEHIETQDCIYYTVQVESTSEGAYRDMARYLKSNKQLPTAFFADNDIIAISSIRALEEASYRIPQDISIVGFDDIPFARTVLPKLTTIHVPKRELGIMAVRQILEHIHKTNLGSCRVVLNTNLVERNSVKIIR